MEDIKKKEDIVMCKCMMDCTVTELKEDVVVGENMEDIIAKTITGILIGEQEERT